MGREANCICSWAGTTAKVKALIEPPELILRGAMRKWIPIAQLRKIQAEGGRLTFEFKRQAFALELGEERARRWADALLKPPPTLAKKLGITGETTVWMMGSVDVAALEEALAQARKVSSRSGDMILARADTPAQLEGALRKAADALMRGTPIWFIYPKGPGHVLNESIVRAGGLAARLVDTKVAAVSPALTALRFVRPKK